MNNFGYGLLLEGTPEFCDQGRKAGIAFDNSHHRWISPSIQTIGAIV